MNLKESISLGIKQLLSNKGRTFLTMLGMFIGVGAVIMILSLGTGFKEYTKTMYSDIGLGAFQLSCKVYSPELLLTKEDFDLIREIPGVQTIMGSGWADGKVYNRKGEIKNISLFGAGPEYGTSIEKISLLTGRLYTEKDNSISAKVVVVSDIFVKLVLAQTNYKSVIGDSIEVTVTDETDNQQTEVFEIIGVYDSKMPKNASDQYLENQVSNRALHIPINTLDKIKKSDGKVSRARGIVKDGYEQKEVTNQIRVLLNRRHQQKDSYEVFSPSDFIEQANQMLNMITLFISAVAGISLVVGGVGIMNIMLVTVKERTREIGIRKALGATNKVILRQFLIEALILTIIAGTIGMLLGYSGSIVIGGMYKIQAKLTLGMILFSAGTSTAIGLLFGVYPAYQAARLDPVESLRYE